MTSSTLINTRTSTQHHKDYSLQRHPCFRTVPPSTLHVKMYVLYLHPENILVELDGAVHVPDTVYHVQHLVLGRA